MLQSKTVEVEKPILPGWCAATLEQISELIFGQSPPSSTYNEERIGLPFYQGKLEFGSIYPTPRKWCSKPQKIANKGDILMSIRAPVGPTNLCPDRSCIGRGLVAIRPSGGIDPLFILYLIRANEALIAGKGTGTTFSAITSNFLRQFAFLLPPFNEQKRIVSKIEELFTKLDAGKESLKRARIQLKRYRQSVLKAGFEGKLTEEWRKKTIQVPPDWNSLPLDSVCEKIQDGSHFSPSIQHSSPGKDLYLYITAKNIRRIGIDLSNVTYVDSAFHREIYRRCDPRRDDVLLVKDGVNTGTVAINTLDEEFSMLSSVTLLRPKRAVLDPLFLKHFLSSPVGNSMIKKVMTGTAIKRIILDKIRASLIPLPSLEEQMLIVKQIETALSAYDATESVIEKSFQHASILRSSILKLAFSGGLIKHDPNDEPAQKLLERLKEQKMKPILDFRSALKVKAKG
ncbi:MAG: restriction endonuclease subunit S [Nitrososphaerales archaeon]